MDAKTSEIPELAPAAAAWTCPAWSSPWTPALPAGNRPPHHRGLEAHYLLFAKANQPSLLKDIVTALNGTDEQFADITWIQEGKGHGRREKRTIRTAPPQGSTGRTPPRSYASAATPALRPARGPPRRSPTASPASRRPWPGPRHLAIYARQHWSIENKEHYVRDVTFREDAQRARTGHQSDAHAAIRNLVMGAFRHEGSANIAHARRYYGRDDQRILALYGYT